MNFNYTVECTKEVTPDPVTGEIPKAITFQPTDLSIIIENKEIIIDENGSSVEIVNVRTILTQIITDGYIKQERMHKLPSSILRAIAGFNPETMQLVVNPIGLNQILAGFYLKLAGT